jgi:hypothetical protein
MPPRDRSGPATTPGRPNAADSTTCTASVHGGEVVDLAAWRDRRAWNAALDYLDSQGLCACWVTGRQHRGAS